MDLRSYIRDLTSSFLNLAPATHTLGSSHMRFFRVHLQASVAPSSLYPIYTLSLNWSENVRRDVVTIAAVHIF